MSNWAPEQTSKNTFASKELASLEGKNFSYPRIKCHFHPASIMDHVHKNCSNYFILLEKELTHGDEIHGHFQFQLTLTLLPAPQVARIAFGPRQ